MMRSMVLIDGENLVCRYQGMVEEGRKPKNNTRHQEDVYVWNPDVLSHLKDTFLRVYYYTSACGDSKKLADIRTELHAIDYNRILGHFGVGGRMGHVVTETERGYIIPKVFHRPSNSRQSKGVDVNLTIDGLNFSRQQSVDAIYILSGDGDFIPLIEAMMRNGKLVHVMGFSSGLQPALRTVADSFKELDSYFFRSERS